MAGLRLVVGPDGASQFLLGAVTVATLAPVILPIGLVAERGSGPGHPSDAFDALMARIPGLGSVYTGRAGEPDTQSAREVEPVEFPGEGAFVLWFLTAEPPESIRESSGYPPVHRFSEQVRWPPSVEQRRRPDRATHR